MRLSQMTTNEAMDVMCEITPYIANIAADEELLSELRDAISPEEVVTRAELLARGADKLSKLVPVILKKRKADVFGILAVLNGKTADEIGRQNIITTMMQIREMIKDRELIDFFKSCVGPEGNV